MIRNFILLILLFISTATSAQSFINMSRDKVKNKLEKYLTDNDLAGKIQETDSTVLLSVRYAKVQNVDFVYRFDTKGKCLAEATFLCDSCVKKYLNSIINNPKLGWKQINQDQYVSKYSKHLSLKRTKEGYSIEKTFWTRSDYESMIGFR